MVFQPSSRDAFRLVMEGSAALTDVESAGMRIDVGYLRNAIRLVGLDIRESEILLKQDSIYSEWRKAYGEKTDLCSRSQLGHVLFDRLRVPCVKHTKSGKYSTSEDDFSGVDIPFVATWLRWDKLKRLKTANLEGILKETVDGFLRSCFNLHLALTHRSSSDSPNFQSLPVRDSELAEIVRTAFIPRDGDFLLVEQDYSGIEVRVAACYHQDPTMVRYILDNHDMHLDMACECYLLDKDQVSKPIRGIAKGGFVFASFYGDWYQSICQILWRAVDVDKLTTKSGRSLRDHLTSKGITEIGDLDPRKGPKPGTFEHHINEVCNRFWGERFPVYAKWKEDWWAEYIRNGWYGMKTGFVCKGVYKRNEVINAPIQGSAFHCLLRSLIVLNSELKAKRMRSRVIGQIHDSIVSDVHKDELQDFVAMSHEIMTKRILSYYPWIVVPLEIEVEASAENWYKKHKIAVSA